MKDDILEVDSNAYYNDPDSFPDNVTLVGSNFGFHPSTKNDPSNLKKMQANIRRRFNLGK